MKTRQYAIIISFILLMAVNVAFSLFQDKDGFSPFENRQLSGPPEVSLGSVFSGKLGDGYESYLLDNFLLRDLTVQGYQAYTDMFFLDAFQENEDVLMEINVDDFVTAGENGNTVAGPGSENGPDSADGSKTAGQRRQAPGTGLQSGSQAGRQAISSTQAGASFVGGDSGTEGQPAAQEGSAYDNGSDAKLNNSLIISGNRVMMPTGANNLDAFGGLLAKIAEILPGKDIYSITGPTSASFYASERYSTGSYDQSRAEGKIESNAAGVKVVEAYDELLAHRDEDIYFRSDVHWTALGAYYAYSAFCRSAGITPASLENDFTPGTYEPFLGGLYSQIYKQPQAARLKNDPEKLDYYVPKTGYQLTLFEMGNLKAPYDVGSIINTDFDRLGAYKYSCFAWGDQRMERITTNAPGGRSVLVVKDSYGSALVPFLIPNYSKIYVIDPKGFNIEGALDFDAKTLIRDENIDDIIFCFSIYGSGRGIIQNGLESLFLR